MSPIPNNEKLITVFGGSGFLGRHIISRLAKDGYRIRAAVRRPDLAGHLQPLGTVGQIHSVQANLRYPDSVKSAVYGSWAVINAVGILFEKGGQKFNEIHEFGAKAIAEACNEFNIDRLVHISAIGASEDSKADYAISKARGEKGAVDAKPDTVILRPSIVFGPEDDFFNRFANMARFSPFLPSIGKGEFQPVYVGDVAKAVQIALTNRNMDGKVYELGGPQKATLAELLAIMCQFIDRKRLIISVPITVAKFQAIFLQLLPTPLLTPDQVRLLAYDNIVSEAAKSDGRTLQGIGINPTDMQVILPTYLERYRKAGQFSSGH